MDALIAFMAGAMNGRVCMRRQSGMTANFGTAPMAERTRISKAELSATKAVNHIKRISKARFMTRDDIAELAGISKSKLRKISDGGLLDMPKHYAFVPMPSVFTYVYAMDEVLAWLKVTDVKAYLAPLGGRKKQPDGIDLSLAPTFFTARKKKFSGNGKSYRVTVRAID